MLKYFEGKRNAKKVMDNETFNQLSKPFQLGWTREVLVRGIKEITQVFYRTPKHLKAKRRRLKSSNEIKDFLVMIGETNLTVDNFSTGNMFLGFEPKFETVRNSSIEHSGYGLISFSKTGWKYDNFFDILNKASCDGVKRIKCLLCDARFSTKGNFGRHMKMSHEPDETCHVCGKDFRPWKMQAHRAKCKNLALDQNDNEVKPEKRKCTEVETEVILNTKKEDLDSSNNMSKPVARKSFPCKSHADTDQLVKCVKLEPDANSQIFKEITPLVKDHHLETMTNMTSQEVNNENGSSDRDLSTKAASKPDLMATLVMTSEEGARVKMKVKGTARVVKGMKKFGQRLGESHENYRFLSNSVELSGEELAEGLDGANILVVRK